MSDFSTSLVTLSAEGYGDRDAVAVNRERLPLLTRQQRRLFLINCDRHWARPIRRLDFPTNVAKYLEIIDWHEPIGLRRMAIRFRLLTCASSLLSGRTCEGNKLNHGESALAVQSRIVCSCLVATAAFAFLSPSDSLAERPAWQTSNVRGAPTPPPPYRVERVFGNHQFTQPVVFTAAPGTSSMFLLEIGGKIFELPSEDCTKPTLIADISKHARDFHMAYGLAFHPNFENNREIYLCYKRRGDAEQGSVVSRFRLTTSDTPQIETDSEQILYTWLAGGHNGGCVKFGPDGYLYVSAGDAADPFPPDHLKAGQDLRTLLSKIVRIDVNGRSEERPYRIPSDNPFVNLAGARPEIYAFGFRNPWRFAFDRETGDLWAGDVGWELWEMVYDVKSGGNYGWSIVEGPHDVDPQGKLGPTPILKPAASHSHSEARSITGGQVYYGDRLPELRGAYVYGDHVTGRMWSLRKHATGYEQPVEIARSPLQIICFGLHQNGEVYVVDYLGSIHRLVRNTEDANSQAFPKTLSESGLFSAVAKHELAAGVLPYSVIAEPWMDGASADRFVAIPGDQKIGVYEESGGHASWDGKHRGSWKFPQDSVLGKTIVLEDRRVETQLLHFDGQAWQPYSYVWNEDQTDAALADDVSQTIQVKLGDRQQSWLIMNRGDCMVCHTNANDMLLGFKPNQLQHATAQQQDQLKHLASLAVFEQPPRRGQTLTNPQDDNADLNARARSYLHVNCAHCHRPEGGGAVAMNVLFDQSLKRTRIIDELPLQGSFGIENANVVASGDPYRSVLLYRFSKLGPGHMPKMGGLEVDQRGAALLHDWIAQLEPVAESSTPSYESNHVQKLQRLAVDESQLIDWLSNVPHAMIATHLIRTKQLQHRLRERLLLVSRQLPATSKDLFESFVPVAERTQRLGSAIDPNLILAQRGNADRGRELFKSTTLSCKSCHSIESDVERVGPNLLRLQPARYNRDMLLQNILQPSTEVSQQYQTHVVQTVDGEILTGVAESKADSIVLIDAQNKVHTIAKEDIEFQKASDVSLMPEKLLQDLTLQQARDLLEFLSSLGPTAP